MKDAAKTIGNLIDHATVSIIGSVDDSGFPNAKAMLPPRRGTESSTSTSRRTCRQCE